ncbi:MAG: hypothetical protein ACE5LC_05665 [Candidatus Aminicenantales bacterium]
MNFRRIIIFSLCLILALSLLAEAKARAKSLSSEVDLISLRFFEGGSTAPPRENRSYTTNFPLSTTRYVYYEVYFRNPYYQVSEHTYHLKARYYREDGSLEGEPEMSYTVPSDWDESYLWHGWGYGDPGNWDPGTYSVELFIDGVRVGKRQFTVYDDSYRQTSPSDLEVVSIRFFEGGYASPRQEERVYASFFPQGATRYVNYEIYIKNPYYQIKDYTYRIKAKYLKPDDTMMGEPEFVYTVPSDWDYGYLWQGFGWREPGNWETGTYVVEVFVEGKSIALSQFTIYDDTLNQPFPTQFHVTSIRFFEGGFTSQPKEERVYTSRFPISSTRFVKCQLDVVNKLYKVKEHAHNVVWKYYYPDGSFMGEVKNDLIIEPAWYTSWISRGWGWKEPGTWEPGTYSTRVFIDGQIVGEKKFTVYEETVKESR